MKIQAVKNYATTGNYQIDKANQQSFGIVIFDERGWKFVNKGARPKIERAYRHAQQNLRIRGYNQNADVLVYTIQKKHQPAGVVIACPSSDGSMKEVSCMSNSRLFDFEVAQHILDAVELPETGGTFAKCIEANPNLHPSLLDTTLPLSEGELQKRFEISA